MNNNKYKDLKITFSFIVIKKDEKRKKQLKLLNGCMLARTYISLISKSKVVEGNI